LAERLQAWKHAVVYLEEYMEAMEKIHGKHAKEYERALKVRLLISSRLGAAFDLRRLTNQLLRPFPTRFVKVITSTKASVE
jgi:hypothetical protein